MKITVENGRRVTIAIPGLGERDGHAVPRGALLLVAFFGEARQLRGVSRVTIDGVEHALAAPAEKGDVKGTVRLTLKAAEAGESA